MSKKICTSPNYNYVFDTENGKFYRWGKTFEDNPEYSPFGPEILDIEISTTCHGINGEPCSFCYKSNGPDGTYMSFCEFEKLFSKLNKELTQIAFGIGDIDANPDLEKILLHCRSNSVIPNITINGSRLSPEIIELLKNCGAVSVSMYDKDCCYDAVRSLTDKGYKQVNIHMLLSEETYDTCFNLITDLQSDKRLSKLNSLVFLLLKPKGNRNNYHLIKEIKQYKKLITECLKKNINFGFDSCVATIFLKVMKNHPNFNQFLSSVEPCESFGTFSAYINVSQDYYPCSFAEDTEGWKEGIRVSDFENIKDLWFSNKVIEWRNKSLTTSKSCNCGVKQHCRPCLIYDINSICRRGGSQYG